MPSLPTIGKTLGISALAGLASEGTSQIVKKNKIAQLIAYKHLLTDKQKQDILNALQTGGNVHIKPTKVQIGSGLEKILASISIPIASDLVKKLKGKGAPRIGRTGKSRGGAAPRMGVYSNPPPFMGNWPAKTVGRGKKKKSGKGLILGKNSPFNSIPILGAIL